MKNLTLAIILLATFLVFRPCLNNEFLFWDDDVHVWNNPAVKTLSLTNLKQIFTTPVNQTYIPLTTLSFALEYQIAADNPKLYHLDNILLHLSVTALLFVLALTLGLTHTAAALACLIFAIHPLHVEPVAWITDRKDMLYSFFYILALWQYVLYTRSHNISNYMISLVAGLLAMLAKPLALSLPLVLFLTDWLIQRKFSIKSILDKIPYALFIVPLGWITYSLKADRPIHDIQSALLTGIWTFTFYIKEFFWPHNLAPLYDMPKPVTITNPAFLIPAACFLLIIGSVYLLRKHRWFIFAWGVYLASIFFIIRFNYKVDAEIVADRFMYLSSFGFCFLAGHVLDRLFQKRHLLAWIALPLFLFMGASSFHQCKIWKNDLTLWQASLAVNPPTSIAFNNLGNYFYKKQDWEQALTYYSRAITLAPSSCVAYSNRGVIYFSQQHYDLALTDFNTALRYKEDFAAYNNRGSIYLTTGAFDKALEDFNRSLQLNPGNANTYFNRGEVYRLTNRPDLALAEYSMAIKLNPRDTDYYRSRNAVYEEKQLNKKPAATYNNTSDSPLSR